MIYVAAALGGFGLVCILLRKTLLGVLIGVQLLVLGATLIFVISGQEPSAIGGGAEPTSNNLIQGHLFGLFIALSSMAQLVVGYALAVRLFYQRKRAGMDEVRSLKH